MPKQSRRLSTQVLHPNSGTEKTGQDIQIWRLSRTYRLQRRGRICSYTLSLRALLNYGVPVGRRVAVQSNPRERPRSSAMLPALGTQHELLAPA